MQNFRKLSKNIFFKIILIIVGLSFVFFGIGGFIADMPNSWTIKVGNERIGVKAFQKSLELDRKIIRSIKGNSPEIEKYLSSERFKSDVANRLVRKILIQKVSEDIGAFGSKKLILKTVAEDKNFQDLNGKFDQKKFSEFLKSNGLDEERYFQEVSNEVSAEMILKSIAMANPISLKNAVEIAELNQEKRVVDLINIGKNNVKNIKNLDDEAINKFYNENKANYKTQETREISYIEIDANSYKNDLTISEDDIKKYYESNLSSLFTKQETKNFYHLVFSEEKLAKEFIEKLNKDASQVNIQERFIKLAKELQKKSVKDIAVDNVAKNSLPADIAINVNNLKIDELSQVITSPLGFHVFLLNKINPEEKIAISQVKDEITKTLIAEKKEKSAQDFVSKINDELMGAKKLQEIADKYSVKLTKLDAVSNDGKTSNGLAIKNIEHLDNLLKNIFVANNNLPSKIFPTQNKNKFYAFEINKIEPSRNLELNEVKDKIIADIIDKTKASELAKFVAKIQQEIKQNPALANKIAMQNGLKFESNKIFPRIFYIDLGSSKMPYKSQILEEIFNLNVGEATIAVANEQGDFNIAILREIKTAKLNSADIAQVKKEAVEVFANEIMLEYNDYLSKKFPIKINEKFFKKET